MGANVRLLRSPRAWAFVAVVVLVSQVVPAASRAATGSISGSVEDVGGSAVRDICVDVFDAASGLAAQRAVTDANGMYTANDLSPGDYKARFSDCIAPNDFAPEWNGGVRDESLASPVTVTYGLSTEVNAALDRWGAITGSVEDVGGSAIRDICVRAFDQQGIGVGWSRTDANGMYTLKIRSLLGTGSYKVRFNDCVGPFDYAREWNDKARIPRLATPVMVTLGQDTEVNAALDRWGAITGSVEDVGGSAIRNICVRALDRHGKGVGWARTDGNGMYTLKIRSLLGTGSYKVRFKDCVGPFDFVTEWNEGARIRRLATPVTVAVGHDTEVDASMERWGVIHGSVEDVDGSAIRDICVRVFDRRGTGAGWARTDGNGMYTLKIESLIGTKRYKVRFKDCVAPHDFAPEWNGGARFEGRAPWVRVNPDSDTEVNAALDRWGAISGTVTADATSMPLPDICVRVFTRFRSHTSGVGWARTAGDGTYSVDIRKPWIDSFKVRFSDCIDPRGYVTEFYDNSSSPWRPATWVSVHLGQTTSGIDAALAGGAGGGGGGAGGGGGGGGGILRPSRRS